MTALTPGLYRATVYNTPDALVLVDSDGDGYTLDAAHVYASTLTDARGPLIILDLDPTVWKPGALTKILRRTGQELAFIAADQIEAQTKPARIPEPGLWGVVEAVARGCGQTRFTFVRVSLDSSGQWVDVEDGSSLDWDDLVDPTLIRDGINGGAA